MERITHVYSFSLLVVVVCVFFLPTFAGCLYPDQFSTETAVIHSNAPIRNSPWFGIVAPHRLDFNRRLHSSAGMAMTMSYVVRLKMTPAKNRGGKEKKYLAHGT